LVTGFDIIFFWVARMMMAGLFTQDGEVPFKEIYIHALVRDEKGAKMSKSKGNVIDPLELIDQYGADALRFTLCAFAAQGRDVKLSPTRVEGYRNFATKLWNAARFAEMNDCVREASFQPAHVQTPLAQWIIHETSATVREITTALETFKFNEAAGAAYRFVWNIFCDWYLEFAKPVFSGEDATQKQEIRATTAWVLDEILKLLHPFMPFITEELWAVSGQTGLLIVGEWPTHHYQFPQAQEEMSWAIDVISTIRSLRVEMNINAGAKIPLQFIEADSVTKAKANRAQDLIMRLARLESIDFVATAPKGAILGVVRGQSLALPLKGVIDLVAEKARLSKELAKIDMEAEKINAKLSNESFVAKAPASVIDENRNRLSELEEAKAKLNMAFERLKDIG
jgi:valyl-tRNA synthetase